MAHEPFTALAYASADGALTVRDVPTRFETSRLILRRAKPDDATSIFHGWAQDPEVTKHLVWKPHTRVEEAAAHIARSNAAWEAGAGYTYFLEDRETGALAGSIVARPGGHGVNLGYLLARPFWGRGFMREAVEIITTWWLAQPDVFRVWATCDTENLRSARVLEGAGFQFEGTLRRWDRHPNVSPEPRDALCYSRTR
jgi:RimJ/RimL family protein N-acetyltransferase